MSFEVRDDVLFEVRAGKPPLKICSAFEIENVVSDSTRFRWGLECWALDVDDQLVRFRILPGDFLTISTAGLEQCLARAGLFLWNPAALVRYLRAQIPAVEPVVVDDLRASDDGANRRFRAAFEKNK